MLYEGMNMIKCIFYANINDYSSNHKLTRQSHNFLGLQIIYLFNLSKKKKTNVLAH